MKIVAMAAIVLLLLCVIHCIGDGDDQRYL
jgi:hypothetical protein